MHKFLSFSIGITLCMIATACNSRSTNEYLIAANVRQGGMFFVNFKLVAIGIDGLGEFSYDFPKELGYQPNWSPDGNWIVTSVGGRAAGSNADLLFVSSDGKYRYRLVTSEQSEAVPVWSPDGKTVLYRSYYDIYTIDASCILQKEKCQPSPTHIAKGIRPAWSPDGKSITFDEIDNCHYENSCNGSCKMVCIGGVFVVRADGSGEPIQITPDEQICTRPQWSPDGQHIVASCNDGLTLVSPAGSTIKPLGIDGYEPSWFPDGSKIAFVSSKGEGLGYMLGWEACSADALFAINPDGSNLQRLTHGKDECILEYTWLPTIKVPK